MRIVEKLLIIGIFLIPVYSFAAVDTHYLTAAGAGAKDGAALVSAFSPTEFNTAANWDTDEADDNKIGPGDTVLVYDDAGVFRSKLRIQGSGLAGKPIIVKNATGETPVFYGSDVMDGTDHWTAVSTVCTDVGLPLPYTCCTGAGTGCANIWTTAADSYTKEATGFVLFGSESQSNVGVRVFDIATLDTDKEFYYDKSTGATGHRMVVYSSGNPYTYYGNIEIGTAEDVTAVYDYNIVNIFDVDYITVDGLTVKYSVSGGIVAKNASNITIQNCNASYGGGGGDATEDADRVGNGIGVQGTSSYIYLTNNNISQWWDSGLYAEAWGNNETIQYVYMDGNTIDKCGHGISVNAVTGDNIIVQYIDVTDNIVSNAGAGWSPSGSSSHGRGICTIVQSDLHTHTMDSVTIAGNTVSGCEGAGIYLGGGTNFRVSRNYVHDNTGTVATTYEGALQAHGGDSGDAVRDVLGTIDYNLIINNARDGLAIVNNQSALLMENNTLYDNGDGAYPNVNFISTSGNTFKNNIVYSIDSACIQDATAFATMDYNMYYRAAGTVFLKASTAYAAIADWRTQTSQDASSKQADPLFNYGVYTTQQSSPARNAGLMIAGLHDVACTDYYGKNCQDTTPDIGCANSVQNMALGTVLNNLKLGTASSNLKVVE